MVPAARRAVNDSCSSNRAVIGTFSGTSPDWESALRASGSAGSLTCPLSRWGITGSVAGSADASGAMFLFMAERVLGLSTQQSGAGTAVLAVIALVTSVIVAIATAVATIVAAGIAPLVSPADQAGTISSISRRHGHAPLIAARRSASAAATSACVGIRSLPSSAPPDVRTAEPTGAARVCSQTSTVAALPGLERLADLTVIGIAQLRGLDRAVMSLRQPHQVKHANGVAVDQRLQLGCHCAREVRLVGRESADQVVDRPRSSSTLMSAMSCSDLWPQASVPTKCRRGGPEGCRDIIARVVRHVTSSR